ncbi:hypothetical protein [Oricola indica]|uniref:hypothetical protein n=1 Tax=Oricola indica TaxID=2872591 RepID=UPI003CCC1F44
MSSITEERQKLVSDVMNRVNAIVSSNTIDRARLDRVRQTLLGLTAHPECFQPEHFAPPDDPKRNSNMFELFRCENDGPTLYVSVAPAGLTTPVHFHTTWAVIAGLRGAEFNQFYTRDGDGRPVATDHRVVENGTAIMMMPEDLHSIRIEKTPERFFSFHCYGMPFEKTTERMFYSESSGEWSYFAHRPNIRRFDLAAGRAAD